MGKRDLDKEVLEVPEVPEVGTEGAEDGALALVVVAQVDTTM